MFALAVGEILGDGTQQVVLAGKSTLNRIEHCPETVTNRADSRYHRIGHDAKAIEKQFVEFFLESYSKPPRAIVLDLDVTDDQVHGSQEQAFFNTYYDGVCYAPLYINCCKHLLCAKLRPSNVDPADGALEELERVPFANTGLGGALFVSLCVGIVRASREEIMKWCESQVGAECCGGKLPPANLLVDYVFGLSQNSRLMKMTLHFPTKSP